MKSKRDAALSLLGFVLLILTLAVVIFGYANGLRVGVLCLTLAAAFWLLAPFTGGDHV